MKIGRYVFLLMMIIICLCVYCVESEEDLKVVDLRLKHLTLSQEKVDNIDNVEVLLEDTDKIGELMIPGTSFLVSVVQTNNNQFYLNHDIYKEYDALGTPFLDYRCLIESRKLLIYGHNSKTIDTDFHFLENYFNQAFYQKYPKLILKIENESLVFQIVSFFVTTDDTHMKLQFSDMEWKMHVEWLKKSSLYFIDTNLSVSDKILILQTCYYKPINSYLLLVAKQVESM